MIIRFEKLIIQLITLIFSIAIIGLEAQSSDKVEQQPIHRKVFFIQPNEGAEISSPVHLVFGVSGLKIKAAGENIDDKSAGHHHLIIDGDSIMEGQVIPPTTTTTIHYGKGQTEATLELPPGKHKLTLQFADGAHRSYGKDLSATISITIKPPLLPKH